MLKNAKYIVIKQLVQKIMGTSQKNYWHFLFIQIYLFILGSYQLLYYSKYINLYNNKLLFCN